MIQWSIQPGRLFVESFWFEREFLAFIFMTNVKLRQYFGATPFDVYVHGVKSVAWGFDNLLKFLLNEVTSYCLPVFPVPAHDCRSFGKKSLRFQTKLMICGRVEISHFCNFFHDSEGTVRLILLTCYLWMKNTFTHLMVRSVWKSLFYFGPYPVHKIRWWRDFIV